MDEKELDYLEAHIPELAEAAVKQAYWQALASGSKVLKSEKGELIEISPDGSRRVLKKLMPSTPVQPGLRLVLE